MQSQACLSYAEVPPMFEVLKDRANRMQSQACLSYAEVPPMFEVYLKDRLKFGLISDFRVQRYIHRKPESKKESCQILSFIFHPDNKQYTGHKRTLNPKP
jgi:hypothetical protein